MSRIAKSRRSQHLPHDQTFNNTEMHLQILYLSVLLSFTRGFSPAVKPSVGRVVIQISMRGARSDEDMSTDTPSIGSPGKTLLGSFTDHLQTITFPDYSASNWPTARSLSSTALLSTNMNLREIDPPILWDMLFLQIGQSFNSISSFFAMTMGMGLSHESNQIGEHLSPNHVAISIKNAAVEQDRYKSEIVTESADVVFDENYAEAVDIDWSAALSSLMSCEGGLVESSEDPYRVSDMKSFEDYEREWSVLATEWESLHQSTEDVLQHSAFFQQSHEATDNDPTINTFVMNIDLDTDWSTLQEQWVSINKGTDELQMPLKTAFATTAKSVQPYHMDWDTLAIQWASINAEKDVVPLPEFFETTKVSSTVSNKSFTHRSQAETETSDAIRATILNLEAALRSMSDEDLRA